MKMLKRMSCFLLAVLLMATMLQVVANQAEATSVSQANAVAWARNQIGIGLDYDGAYGNQCVDLIYYYYRYLGVSPVGGNANAYISNSLPSGWTRISSNFVPQPGDIAVWKTNYPGWTTEYGHVSIVVSGNSSTFSTIHQNYAGRAYCSQTDNLSTNLLACVIRPNFSGNGSTDVSLSWDHYADKHWIGTDNAVLAGWVNMNVDNRAISQAGIYLYDYKGDLLKSKTETASSSGYYHFYLWYDVKGELGYTLLSGTPYKYKFMLVINGKTYYSPLYSFTTGGTHTHRYNGGAVTKQPSCTGTGTKTYTCTTCGGTKSETISAKGHNYASATCTSPKRCKTCGTTSGSALGHNYASATCLSPKKCKVCGVTSGVALEHNYGDWTIVRAATCIDSGMRQKICKTCNNAVVHQGIAPTGHNYTNGKCTACGKADPNKKAVKITTQPKNVVVKSGKTAKVTVKASGDGLKYTWYYAKKGATKWTKASSKTSSFSVKMSSSYDGCRAYCVITDKYGSTAKSSTVTLYKGTPAKITTQPKSTTVVLNKTGKLTIKASGTGLKYTWYIKNKGETSFTKTSTTSNTYSFKMADKLNGAQVYCVVKDKYGTTVKSSVVTIKMAPKVKITTQPKNVAVAKGKTAKVTVKASGEGLKYTWYYAKKGSSSFKKLSAKSATYSVKMSSTYDGRKVYCVVTDKYGQTVKTSTVTLSMVKTAKITTQPKNISVLAGKTAQFTVKATGDGLKYSWYFAENRATEWVKVSGNTVASGDSNVLSFKATAPMDGYIFLCSVKDKYGNEVASKMVTLTVKSAAKITKQPSSVSVANGNTAKVTVKASGDGLKYTWYYANKGATKWTKTSVTSATYSVKMSSSVNGRRVYCVVKDKYGNTVKSNIATLSMSNNLGKAVGYWKSTYGVDADGSRWSEFENEFWVDIYSDGSVCVFVAFMESEFNLKIEFVKTASNKYYYRVKDTGKDLDTSGSFDVIYNASSDTMEFKFSDGLKVYFKRYDW